MADIGSIGQMLAHRADMADRASRVEKVNDEHVVSVGLPRGQNVRTLCRSRLHHLSHSQRSYRAKSEFLKDYLINSQAVLALEVSSLVLQGTNTLVVERIRTALCFH